MLTIQTVTIQPKLPESLAPLMTIAKNLWWSWTPEAIHLFQDMDRDLWERGGQNPVAMLGSIRQPRLEELGRDEIFLARMKDVSAELERYLGFHTWYDNLGFHAYHYKTFGRKFEGHIAYFSAEFGLHESLPFYSGGLGILAGDHIKSASDLGLPLVGIGLLYKHGYFRQHLTSDGWQMETYPMNDFYNMPLTLARDKDGEPIMVKVELAGRQVYVRIWSLQVGRVCIYLLDTDVPFNAKADRQITSHLYGGDLETRLQQEIVLGMGGIQVLEALGLSLTVCHMNEGHSAFMAVQRIISLMLSEGFAYEEALETVRDTSVFTTHTPVSAGIDRFPADLLQRYFTSVVDRLGINMKTFLDLGRINPDDTTEPFCMTVLAIKTASWINGVSKLHGEVSQKMWAGIWPQIPSHEVPTGYITNGVHTQSWLSFEMARLYRRYLGSRWVDEPANHAVWERVDLIPDFELWRSRERLREQLISFARLRLKQQLRARGVPPYKLAEAEEVLDPEALTIGFARRFASYKRATLVFHDLERLTNILSREDRPVQIIFSGKAHPQDKEGKELIHQVIQMANRPELRKRIVFLENYDIEVARNLVQGVDVWLNTPRRPMEASGTSGMKVTANGGINLSVLDGWWCEGYNRENGWAIGAGEEYEDHVYQDEIESRLFYELLENTVVPLFYNRGPHNIPLGWVETMRNSIKSTCPIFNANRLVEDYVNQAYLPNILHWMSLSKDDWKELRELVVWKSRVKKCWEGVRIVDVQVSINGSPKVGDLLPIKAIVDLGSLGPDEVRVGAYIGCLDAEGNIPEGEPLALFPTGKKDGSEHVFKGTLSCLSSGKIGFAIRCYPYHKGLTHKFELGLLTWWEAGQ